MADQIATGIQWVVDDSTGAVTGYRRKINGVDTAFELDAEAIQSSVSGVGIRGTRAPVPLLGDSGMTVGGVTINSGTPALSVVTMPDGRQALRIACNNGENTEVKFTGLSGCLFSGEMYVQAQGATFSNGVSQYLMYASPDATRGTNSVSAGFGGYSVPLNTPMEPCQGVLTHRLGKADWAIAGTITYPFVADWVSLRLIPRAGFAPVVFVYGIGFAPQPAAGRVCVTVDDGYDAWFALGQPLMQARGIPVTMALIPSNMDTGAANAYWRQMRGLVNAGGAVVAHGPNIAGGAGNLLTAFGNNADRVADVVGVTRAIEAQGLATPGYQSCYVWPQGVWQNTLSDASLLDAMLDAGYTTGRSATPSALYWNADALSKYQRLTMPIIGHTWAGTTAAEATNIAAIVAAINNAAAQGSDINLMLHRVQPTSTADGSMSSIGIRYGDLVTIADAIAAKVTAGTLQPIRLTDLAAGRPGNFWSA